MVMLSSSPSNSLEPSSSPIGVSARKVPALSGPVTVPPARRSSLSAVRNGPGPQRHDRCISIHADSIPGSGLGGRLECGRVQPVAEARLVHADGKRSLAASGGGIIALEDLQAGDQDAVHLGELHVLPDAPARGPRHRAADSGGPAAGAIE